MMASKVRRYAFINAKLRARLAKMLDDNLVEQLIEAPSLNEALVLLRDTPFGVLKELYDKSGDLKSGELELLGREIELYREIEKYVKGVTQNVIRAFLIYYEIENIKNAIRIFFEKHIRGLSPQENGQYLYLHKIQHDIPIDRIVNAKSFDEVIEAVGETPYAKIIEGSREKVERERTLFPLEVAFDHHYYKNLIATAECLPGRDRDITQKLIGVEIDLQNINWIIRFKSFYDLPLETVLPLTIPRGFNISQKSIKEAYTAQSITGVLQGIIKKKYPGLTALLSKEATDSYSRLLLIERILEQILLHEVSRILTGYPFTIGIILAYFVLKRNEMRRIRAILNAKQYNLSKDRIMGII